MACNGMAPSNSSSSPSFFHPSFMLQMQTPQHEQVEEEEDEEEHHYHHHHHQHLPPAATNLHELRGMAPLMLGKRSMSFSAAEMNGGGGGGEEEVSDEEGSQAGEKKRRLNMEQVRTLEKNFELGNKLEPERKMQLARALGMQPRQVAIWFQNRRARWKTKQLERDFDMLKRQFEAIKSENEALKSHNKQLQSEILAIKGREASDVINLNKETEGSCSNRSENSSEINLDISRHSAIKSPQQFHPPPPPPPHHHQPPPFFQSLRPPDMNQLFQSTSSRPDQAQCPKLENGVPESNFSNLLCSMEDQSAAAFWSWSDHHNFH